MFIASKIRSCVGSWFAPSFGLECGAASGMSSCSLSQKGYRPSDYEPPNRLTNVDGITQGHANPRAIGIIATSVVRSTHSTLPQINRNGFLWSDLRRADYYANLW
jgi:hypothetical protein